jgi:uridine kinase
MSEIIKNSENKLNDQIRERPYLIGISGGSGGGKTSVANVLYKCLGIQNCLLFSMDTYYKNLTPEQEKNLSNYNFDTPDALDLDLIYEHLSNLMQWKSVDMPTYDFNTNSRQKETIHLNPNKFIIFEGILAFHDKRMRDLMDLKLFIDLDDDIRLSRRIYRDIISRGRKMETVIERYHKFVKPAYNTFIKPTKKYADIIIPRGGSNTIAIDLINYHLKYNMIKMFPEKIDYIIDKLEKCKNNIEENEKLNYDNKKGGLNNKEVIKDIKIDDIFDEKICALKENEKQFYLVMFNNYLNMKKYQYFDLYLDIYTKKIYTIVNNNIIIFKNEDMKKVESLIQKTIKNKQLFDIYIYIPILFEISTCSKKLDYLKGINEINKIYIISIFMNKNIYEKYQEKKFIFKSIYCGPIIDNHKNYIENGGFYRKMEGEYASSLLSLSEEIFEERLAELIEMNMNKTN